MVSFFRLSLIGYVTVILCFDSRVKKAFYADIPEPRLPGNWSKTQVQYLFNSI